MNSARITHQTVNGVRTISLTNGIVSRTFTYQHTLATISLRRHSLSGIDVELVRATSYEASLVIDKQNYIIGGAVGQRDNAFIMEDDIPNLRPHNNDVSFLGIRIVEYHHSVESKKTAAKRGISLIGMFEISKGTAKGVLVNIKHTVFDDLPTVEKQVEVVNQSSKPICLNSIVFENLPTVEMESVVDPTSVWEKQLITVLSDFMFHGMTISSANQIGLWRTDEAYATQVNYELKTPCKLVCTLPNGPDVDILPNERFVSPRAILVCHASADRELRGRDIRQTWRGLAPWIADNPLMLHLTSTNEATVRTAIDQCADCGFEMVIFSFGSGLNMEDTSAQNIGKFKAFADYAHSKRIRIGGYSLLASRSVSREDDVINPETGTTGGTIFGNSPCLCSKWGIDYFKQIKRFIIETGFDLLEHDGSYPGDVCASVTHPGHKGKSDSQWRQFELIRDLYMWCRKNDIYLNVPDTYFLCGSNKVGMGYRETNWSLPRTLQHIHARQNMFDGTWEKAPSMGWMFVPLVQYHGGGVEATIEPLREHIQDYKRHLESCLGYGVQACYRGPRLYDSPETKAMVTKVVSRYKNYRALLEGDVIHIKRPDGRQIDAIMHTTDTKSRSSMFIAYNPVENRQSASFTLPEMFSPYKKLRVVNRESGNVRILSPGTTGRFTIDLTLIGGEMQMLELVQ